MKKTLKKKPATKNPTNPKWIKWTATPTSVCPVHPDTVVQVKMANGDYLSPMPAMGIEWFDCDDYVKAYRIVKPAPKGKKSISGSEPSTKGLCVKDWSYSPKIKEAQKPLKEMVELSHAVKCTNDAFSDGRKLGDAQGYDAGYDEGQLNGFLAGIAVMLVAFGLLCLAIRYGWLG